MEPTQPVWSYFVLHLVLNLATLASAIAGLIIAWKTGQKATTLTGKLNGGLADLITEERARAYARGHLDGQAAAAGGYRGPTPPLKEGPG